MTDTGQNDDTFTWALDRLLDSRVVPVDVLTAHVLPAVASRPDELPDVTRAKLCLRLLDELLAAGHMDESVLCYLQQLAACDVAPLADPALVCPSDDLILRVKTELGIQTWRDHQGMAPAEAEAVLNRLFAGECTAAEYARYERLKAALRSPALARALEADFPFQPLLAFLINFVAKALTALPSILLTVQADVQAGRYMLGAAPQQHPAPSAPMPSRLTRAALPSLSQQPGPSWRPAARGAGPGLAAARSPLRLQEDGGAMPAESGNPFQSPPRQRPQQALASPSRERQSVLRNLDVGVADLAQQGGRDPLPEMLEHAADAVAAAAARGRSVRWNSDSPAVQHPMPEMRAPRYQQHQPLPQPSPARQSVGRAASGAEVSAGRQHGAGSLAEGGKPRRKRVLWTDDEINELIRLVKLYGRGNWASIVEQGANVFSQTRSSVDMKDKWRNLTKTNKITEEEIEAIEDKERELREELQGLRRGGRPPKFVSPMPKRRQVGAEGDDGDDDEEEGEDGDHVQDADEEEQGDGASEEQEEEQGGEDEDEGEEDEQMEIRGKGDRKGKRSATKEPPRPRRSTRRH